MDERRMGPRLSIAQQHGHCMSRAPESLHGHGVLCEQCCCLDSLSCISVKLGGISVTLCGVVRINALKMLNYYYCSASRLTVSHFSY